MPNYTSFQFLQSIEDKLSEKVFSDESLAEFVFETSRLLNFREEQATLQITLLPKASEEEKAEESKESAEEETSPAGKIEIQEVPHKGTACAFQCFITFPESATQGHTPMLISDDNLLERESLRIALYYQYYLQEAIKDKLKEDTFKPQSSAKLKESVNTKVDELIPRVEPVKEDPKAEATEGELSEAKEEEKEPAQAEA